MLGRDEIGAWLRLLLTEGVGRAAARQLLAHFGGPQPVFEASARQLEPCVGARLAAALRTPPEGFEARLEATLAWLDADAARAIVTLGDPEYPAALLQTADPPLLLYLHGDATLLGAPSVAIVGSRNPTAQGADNARAFARHLSEAGFTVVSGLALGIDGFAHEGALEGRGRTVAVVGTGLDRIYPSRHRALAHRIAAQGLLVSEFPLGTPPLRENFPQRNRIIAGLSRGTLVVEAALASGSLITARQAAEAGREVFAIPGSIHSPQSRGCHRLIKQGAKLVDAVSDLLEELGAAPPMASRQASARPSDSGDGGHDGDGGDPVLQALGHDPATLDTLVARTGWPASRLNARLLELELEARVVRLPGGSFQRRAGA